eukprot:59010_1
MKNPISIGIVFLLIAWTLFVCMMTMILTGFASLPVHIYSGFNAHDVLNNTAHQRSQINFGIVLFAYGRTEDLSTEFLKEAHALCYQLQLKHANQPYHLNISLFTMKHHYRKYIRQRHYSSDHCVFHKVIFLEHLATRKHNVSAVLQPHTNKEWSTRIELLPHSPYYLTMSLDTDFYPCGAFNVTHLYAQMMQKNIDFAYTSFRINHNYGMNPHHIKFPQGGLLLYRKNNKTKYLFDEWQTYHAVNNLYDDQDSLYHTLLWIIPLRVVNVYMLNNRYNFRGFAFKKKIQYQPWYQPIYPTNKIIMFHRRINYAIATGTQRPDLICQMLNK